MGTLTVILEVLLGLAFIGAGASKLAGAEQMVEDFARFKYPRWFMYLTGAVEIFGAVGMLAGIFVPVLALLGGLLLATTMIGAVFTHVRAGDPVSRMVPPAIFLILALAIVVLVWA